MENVAVGVRRPRRPHRRRSFTGLLTWSLIVLIYSLAVDLVSPRPEPQEDKLPNLEEPEVNTPETKSTEEPRKQEQRKLKNPQDVPAKSNQRDEPKKDRKGEDPRKSKEGKVGAENSKKQKEKGEAKKAEETKEKPEEGQIKTTLETKIVEEERKTSSSDVNANATEGPAYDSNCPRPAIEQFPKPLIGPNARRHGALVIHLALAVYTFIGLAIVCDEYFVSSLDRICEEIKLSPDVAGATFMAAGSSAPELATVIISVFLARDDIGISGVIGSAVFNILFVIGICALYAGAECKLNWWPMCRDCFWYALSIIVMLFTIWNDLISWFEALFMLLLYVGYCVSLHFNAQVERWANTLPLPCKPGSLEEASHLVTYRTLPEDHQQQHQQNQEQQQRQQLQSFGNFGWDDPDPQQQQPQQQQPEHVTEPAPVVPPPVAPAQPEYYKPKEHVLSDDVNPLELPLNATTYEKIRWGTVVPIHYLCRKTMPNCKTERFRQWYPFTFVVSMIWISFYSYIMVWMITIIGSTLGIPDTVMGLTFVAAGVSVPDALSSLAVVKEGYGDMAVSNAVGSNVFDILVCLGLPWFLKTAIISPGSYVKVYSKGLPYSTLSLLSTVIFLLVTTHFNGWKLDKKYGIILMMWYAGFILFATLYELNFFGGRSGPACRVSDY